MDDASRSSAVHHAATDAHRLSRLSSTGPTGFGASVSGTDARLSPVSTTAKTTDENLSSRKHNDKSDHPVDGVDSPLCERSTT